MILAGEACPNVHIEDDIWSSWLLSQRHGGDPEYAGVVQKNLGKIRDHVLDRAKLCEGDTLLDVGTGDGLVAFGALERLGLEGVVTLADVSKPILAHAERVAESRGVKDRCRFVEARAENLTCINSNAMDVVTCRSVLAYVQLKQQAINEFFRVLKPNGRVSLAEPINRDRAIRLAATQTILDSLPIGSETTLERLVQRFKTSQYPTSAEGIMLSSMTNFTERDLFQMFQNAGFTNVDLELHMKSIKSPAMTWPAFLDSPPFPGALSPREIFRNHFSLEEVSILEGRLRRMVETGEGETLCVMTYITALKPYC